MCMCGGCRQTTRPTMPPPPEKKVHTGTACHVGEQLTGADLGGGVTARAARRLLDVQGRAATPTAHNVRLVVAHAKALCTLGLHKHCGMEARYTRDEPHNQTTMSSVRVLEKGGGGAERAKARQPNWDHGSRGRRKNEQGEVTQLPTSNPLPNAHKTTITQGLRTRATTTQQWHG